MKSTTKLQSTKLKGKPNQSLKIESQNKIISDKRNSTKTNQSITRSQNQLQFKQENQQRQKHEEQVKDNANKVKDNKISQKDKEKKIINKNQMIKQMQQLQLKLLETIQALNLTTKEKEQFQSRLVLKEQQIYQKQTASKKMQQHVNSLNIKIQKMKKASAQNQRLLRQRINNFNQQGNDHKHYIDEIQKLNANIIKLKQQLKLKDKVVLQRGIMTQWVDTTLSIQLKEQIIKSSSSIPCLTEKQTTQLGVNTSIQLISTQSQTTEPYRYNKELSQLIQKIEKAFQETIKNNIKLILDQKQQIQQLQEIIDQMNQKAEKIKPTINMDNALLQQIHNNQQLSNKLRQLKSTFTQIQTKLIQQNLERNKLEAEKSVYSLLSNYISSNTQLKQQESLVQKQKQQQISCLKKQLEKLKDDNIKKQQQIKNLSINRKVTIVK